MTAVAWAVAVAGGMIGAALGIGAFLLLRRK